jgi:carboxylesterase
MQTFPAKNYEEAVRRIEKLKALDTEEVNPISYTTFLTHGKKTERAILLLHGYTSSPRLYVKFADEFFKRGYNVLIPRFPHHGMKNRMTSALKNQTEQELLSVTNEALDILQGLGDQVIVTGFSMGGALTLWAAQHRADVSLACAISPALAYHAVPLALTPLVIQAFLWMPNQFWWWDDKLKDAPTPPLHAYPRYSTRGLAHLTNVGLKVRALSRQAKPLAGSVLVVTNPTDENVNNAYAHEIVNNWKALGAQQVRFYEFDPSLKLLHDIMDPDQPYQQVDVVYPILFDLIAGR